MHQITVIGTRHDELGACNPTELYKRMEYINPEIIFEEKPPSYYDQYYKSRTRSNLESITVHKYQNQYDVIQVLVDSENIPSDDFFTALENLNKKIEGLADMNGFNYRTAVDKHRLNCAIVGFEYLNSLECFAIQNRVEEAIAKGLEKLNNEQLFQVYKSWQEVNDKREHEMLRNIYKFSKTRMYNKAVFLVGAAHLKSLMQKIEQYNQTEAVKLNWILGI